MTLCTLVVFGGRVACLGCHGSVALVSCVHVLPVWGVLYNSLTIFLFSAATPVQKHARFLVHGLLPDSPRSASNRCVVVYFFFLKGVVPDCVFRASYCFCFF